MQISKSFLTRALSALVAVIILAGLLISFGGNGFKIAVAGVVVIGSLELLKILFKNDSSIGLKILFFILCLLVFASTTHSLAAGTLTISVSIIVIIIASLLLQNKSTKLDAILAYQAKALMGLFYIGFLPSFAYKIIDQPEGVNWFIFLLASVFAGDTVAYIFGILFGKHKMMPSVSPKKTWQGSVGGLLGSIGAGAICWALLFPGQNLFAILLLSGLAGIFGQFGDLFESLIKRVAQVKDSGKIMPGHGGVLDRIDGVLFASPVVLSGILTLSHLLS